jgi:hypothetical protein
MTGRGPGHSGLLTRRCDPYGAESSIRLMGGIYPEAYNGGIHWFCDQPATHRVRMVCRHGHEGDPMWICNRHHAGIQGRQAGLCTRCAWPPEARAVNEAIDRAGAELAELELARVHMQDRRYLRAAAAVEDGRNRMNELMARGIIRKVALRLVEVS